jgi:hypothetical protein
MLSVLCGTLLSVLLGAAPASATVIVSSSNPGNWWQNDTMSQPSHRCYYKVISGWEYKLLTMKIWPPHVQSQAAGTKLRWRFMIRKIDWPPSDTLIYTSSWQTQIKPSGAWATSFSPVVWTAPTGGILSNVEYYVWTEIQWRNATTNASSGSVRYRLEWYREMKANGQATGVISDSYCFADDFYA